ncbi:MAG: type II toxin-antitoxin system VapB family antitoxin [Actinomycetota bacterium]|nr:type II toxin-antitoxin system VapB family antitoxin [Actinomycetota bacterium]
MRTTVNIDGDLLAEVKQIAARGHRTIGSVLEDALRRMLADSTPTSSAAQFSLPSHGSGGLRPGVDLEDRERMAELLGDNAASKTA